MKLREALRTQSPSLALQRSAADEIASLDGLLREALDLIDRLKDRVEYSRDPVLSACRAFEDRANNRNRNL